MKSIVVEAHPLVRTSATHVLQSLPAITEVVSVEPDETLFESLTAHVGAKLALIGLPLPGIGDLPALSRLLQQPYPQHVAILGETDSAAHMHTLMQSNVSTYLLKSYSGKLIAATLELVLAGGRHMPASIVLTRPEANVAGSSSGNGNDDCILLDLTQRQYEILILLSHGHPIKTVSRMLNISETTTEAHINTLYHRLEVRSRTETAFVATQRGTILLNQPDIGTETASPPTRPLRPVRTGWRQP